MTTRRWRSIERLLSRPSSFGNETGKLANGYYEPDQGPIVLQRLQSNLQPHDRSGMNDSTNDTETDNESSAGNISEAVKVLVVGAGGLGCEILKDLALSGITDIHVIGDHSMI